jgi:DNA-binding Lrp family transcriptional regulator
VRPTDDVPDDRLRLTVPEAAKALGISPEAVRNRLSRRTLDSEKIGGTVHVLIDRDMARHTADTPGGTPRDGPVDTPGYTGRDELVDELRDRIGYLQR